jgi:myo-inositol-1(or 4)-monophosphatase
MNDTDLLSIREFAESIARRAGQCIAEHRAGKALSIQQKKNARDLVTPADLAADRLITDAIRQAFPSHRILSEESSGTIDGEALSHGQWWIIDPIDGTVNFAAGQRHVGVSIAYAQGGVVQVGVVHAPFLDESFSAVRGQGATLNGVPIGASQNSDLVRSTIATGFPSDRSDLEPLVWRVRQVLRHAQDIRRLGAASIDTCWVACGRIDAYYETVWPWDIAAGALIAREAGARTGEISPHPRNALLPSDLRSGEFLVAAPNLYEKIKAVLTRPQ